MNDKLKTKAYETMEIEKATQLGESNSTDLLSRNGWGLRRHVPGEIVVTHKDGSGSVIREDVGSIAETLFYRMMDDFLTER